LKALYRGWRRLHGVFACRARERELDAEMRSHIEMQTRDNVRAGMTPDTARRAALLKFGGIESTKEYYRDQHGWPSLEAVWMDVRSASRVLKKSPGFTLAVVLSLGLGIGANTAIFSLIDVVLWRMLPVQDPAGLWVLEPGLTYQQYRALGERNEVARLAAYAIARFNVSIDGRVEPTADGQLVSGGYFSLLGVEPVIGRRIGEEDDRLPNGHPVAMISAGYWKRRFGGEPSVLGRVMSISGRPFTIIGVTPPEFFGVEVGMNPDVFVPVMMQPTVMPSLENLLERPIIYRTWLTTLLRLQPGVPFPRAATDLEGVWRREVPPAVGKPVGPPDHLALRPAATGLSSLRSQFSQPLFVLMAIVGVVLVIACLNTANLLLARAAARRPELAMRLALGASRWRVTRQLLVESVVLAVLGGAAGIALAFWATRLLLIYMSSGRSPIVLDVSPNVRTLAFTAAVSVATGIVFGLAPALRGTRTELWSAFNHLGSLARRGHGTLGPRKVLATFQVALSLLLLIMAGLFVRSLQRLSGDDFGVSRQTVLVVPVEPRGSDQRNIPGTTARLDGIYRTLVERVATIPGVRSVSLGQSTPTRPVPGAMASVPLPSGDALRVPLVMLYANYFATIGVPLVAGRDFTDRDLEPDAPAVCVVNEAFARQMFPGQDPIGRTCFTGRRPRVRDATGPRYDTAEQPYQIVGVVKDSRYAHPRSEVQPVVYLTFLQTGTGRGQMVLHVRVDSNLKGVVSSLRQEILRVDPTLPTFDIHTLSEEMDAALIQERLIAMLARLFGALALLLSSIGLYGLLAFGVVQRTAELGLRMALGAGRGDVVRMIVQEALLLVAAGMACGVPLAFAVSRLAGSQISGLLFGVEATDPLVIAQAGALLLAVSAIAAYLPARRASQVDPLVALRTE
jgi:predicted permease